MFRLHRKRASLTPAGLALPVPPTAPGVFTTAWDAGARRYVTVRHE